VFKACHFQQNELSSVFNVSSAMASSSAVNVNVFSIPSGCCCGRAKVIHPHTSPRCFDDSSPPPIKFAPLPPTAPVLPGTSLRRRSTDGVDRLPRDWPSAVTCCRSDQSTCRTICTGIRCLTSLSKNALSFRFYDFFPDGCVRKGGKKRRRPQFAVETIKATVD
jgi:hypothetical protein